MSKRYTSQTHSNGVTYTTEHDTDNEDPRMVGCLLLLLGLVFIAVVVAQVIYVKTGTNVFDMLDGITGPCGTCTPEGN